MTDEEILKRAAEIGKARREAAHAAVIQRQREEYARARTRLKIDVLDIPGLTEDITDGQLDRVIIAVQDYLNRD